MDDFVSIRLLFELSFSLIEFMGRIGYFEESLLEVCFVVTHFGYLIKDASFLLNIAYGKLHQ